MALSTPKAAYRDPNVLRWAGGYTASVAGDVVYFLVLAWAVTRSAGAAEVGAVLAVGAVPRAVLMLVGGVVADRFGPRRIVIASDLVRCLLVLSVAVAVFAAGTRLWLLFGLALVFGVVDALFMPAVGALPPRIAEPEELARVQGLRTLAVRISNAAGPLIAAVVLTASGAAGGFAVAGSLFGLSVVLLIGVRVKPLVAQGDPADDGVRAGLSYLRRNKHLSRLVVVIGLSELCFSGPVGIGLVLLVGERNWSAGVLGWALSVFSIGGAVAGVLLTLARRIPRADVTLATSLLLTAVLVAAVGQVSAAVAVVVVAAALGAISGVSMGVANALLQRRTDARYLGRVSSVTAVATVGLSPLLYPLTGLAAAAWGAGAIFLGCGAVCLIAAGAAATTSGPAVRGR
ncbi:MFS transporter [Kribbella capetownensis]|uniref:MFS transporter n=1 Tax=Kribbella capetownensis TaxID=1572659 RepID=A0A4R0JUP6_9ACTN|nr:MFS transporter [Kribbella capetownensis]TCC49904.1 MFS transporter [Kribbella capetownensis]